MLKPVFDYVRQLLAVKRQTENNTNDVMELREEAKQMATALQRLELRMERLEGRMDRLEDNTRRDLENLVLRLENALLKFELRLPPAAEPKQLGDD